MTNPATSAARSTGAAKLLIVLSAVVVAVALFTPEEPGSSEGDRSTYSTGPGGARIAYELAQRTGWHVQQRIAPLDSVSPKAATQAVIGPQLALGAHEVHWLLENVRHGGSLIVTVDGGDEITDSLGVDVGGPAGFLEGRDDPACQDRSSLESRVLAIPLNLPVLEWKRAPAGLVTVVRGRNGLAVAQGFPLGQGRVVVASESAIFSNDAVRVCRFAADLAVARILEYAKPASGGKQLVFDEYHHGFGIHRGPVAAIWKYLSNTASGHFLAQMLLSGLIVLLALGPRPLPPVDPVRLPRRSPLEHADALANAYADVGATKTATERLVSGLRRRTGRTVSAPPGASDASFLDAVAERDPSLSEPVETVRRALRDSIPAAELNRVGDAIRDIERQLLLPPQRTK